MTKITEQLEALNPEELKYIYDDLVDFNEKLKLDKSKAKAMISFMKDIADLAEAHFSQSNDFEVKPLDLTQDGEIKQRLEKMEKDIEISDRIINKLKPLIDSL